MSATRLTAFRLPERLLQEIDGFVGPGKRSEFIVRAVEKALLQLRQEKALKTYGGTWTEDEHPEFATPEDTEKWVRQVREGGEERVRRPIGK